MPMIMTEAIAISIFLSFLGFLATFYIIPAVSDLFILRGLCGKDMLKPKAPSVPESMGVIVGVVYFVVMFLFIPVPLMEFIWADDGGVSARFISPFPHDQFAQFLGGLLSISAMLFLGFADDVLDIKWRVKIWFPLIASMPLLMVYYITYGVTVVLVPLPLRSLMSTNLINLGIFYYIYMGAMAVFSTNAINILAGANGVEGVQCLVLAISLIINSFIQLHLNVMRSTAMEMSLYFLIPYSGTTFGYLLRNWYPAQCFGGDTMVYFSGMVFAVVGIMSNLSKTVLLFMALQIFNFLFSCPQLFKFVPCPRHRMPKLSPSGSTIEYSSFDFEDAVGFRQKVGRLMISFLEGIGLVKVVRTKAGKWKSCNNLTFLNLILLYFGPMKESDLAWFVCASQICGSLLAFFVRYCLVHILYN